MQYNNVSVRHTIECREKKVTSGDELFDNKIVLCNLRQQLFIYTWEKMDSLVSSSKIFVF
jgi:hypothetical protein